MCKTYSIYLSDPEDEIPPPRWTSLDWAAWELGRFFPIPPFPQIRLPSWGKLRGKQTKSAFWNNSLGRGEGDFIYKLVSRIAFVVHSWIYTYQVLIWQIYSKPPGESHWKLFIQTIKILILAGTIQLFSTVPILNSNIQIQFWLV